MSVDRNKPFNTLSIEACSIEIWVLICLIKSVANMELVPYLQNCIKAHNSWLKKRFKSLCRVLQKIKPQTIFTNLWVQKVNLKQCFYLVIKIKTTKSSLYVSFVDQNLQGGPWSYGHGLWKEFKIEKSKWLGVDCESH